MLFKLNLISSNLLIGVWLLQCFSEPSLIKCWVMMVLLFHIWVISSNSPEINNQESTMHFITRVSRFFDNNFVTLSWIANRFQHNVYVFHSYVILSSHTTFLNYSTNKFTLVNNSLLSQIVALEHSLRHVHTCIQPTCVVDRDAIRHHVHFVVSFKLP